MATTAHVAEDPRLRIFQRGAAFPPSVTSPAAEASSVLYQNERQKMVGGLALDLIKRLATDGAFRAELNSLNGIDKRVFLARNGFSSVVANDVHDAAANAFGGQDAGGTGAAKMADAHVIGSNMIAAGTIASGTIAAGTIASGTIASGTIASGTIAAGTIASGTIAAGAIASAHIASGTVVANDADDAVDVLKSA